MTRKAEGRYRGCDCNCYLDHTCHNVNRRTRRWARKHGMCRKAREDHEFVMKHGNAALMKRLDKQERQYQAYVDAECDRLGIPSEETSNV
jgi:hypothetical protein